MLGRGLKLVDGNDNEWELNQLLFANDTVVVANSLRKLCQLVTEFGRECERRKLRGNVGKSKVTRCTRNKDGARLNVMLNGEALNPFSSTRRTVHQINKVKVKGLGLNISYLVLLFIFYIFYGSMKKCISLFTLGFYLALSHQDRYIYRLRLEGMRGSILVFS